VSLAVVAWACQRHFATGRENVYSLPSPGRNVQHVPMSCMHYLLISAKPRGVQRYRKKKVLKKDGVGRKKNPSEGWIIRKR
jgi:hypothetical protein